MRAARQSIGGWWSSGGTICGPAGPLTADRALELFRLYGREALARDRNGERAAARLCAQLALTLGQAILASDDWRCAARGLPRYGLHGLRDLARDVKFARYG